MRGLRNYVFDSFAVIAFYADEPGADTVEKLLVECACGRAEGLISVVNWGEVFYSVSRVMGEKRALEVVEEMEHLPLAIVDADKKLTLEAARLKARYRIAYADCFALALAKLKGAFLVTGDPEFRRTDEGVEFVWLPQRGG